jgi:hypothetical protein
VVLSGRESKDHPPARFRYAVLRADARIQRRRRERVFGGCSDDAEPPPRGALILSTLEQVMKRLLVLALFPVAFAASAQSFGERFPLTNTRYAPAMAAEPRLATSDRDFFLFWNEGPGTRVAKLQDGVPRGSSLLPGPAVKDVAWAGDHFLTVATRVVDGQTFLMAQRLDAEAHPIFPEITITDYRGLEPRIAVGTQHALVIYGGASETRSILLERDGTPIGESLSVGPGSTSRSIASHGDGFVAVTGHGAAGIVSRAFDGNGNPIGESTSTDTFVRDVDVASDGSAYVAVWSDGTRIYAASIDQNGTIRTPIPVTPNANFPRNASVSWTGGSWVVSYQDGDSTSARARIVHLDAWLHILSSEVSAAGVGIPATAALDGRIFAAWRPNAANAITSVIELPLADHELQSPPYAATRQTLIATASSDDATLILWREAIERGTTIHAGVRGRDGKWTEHLLKATGPNTAVRAVAASDGREFVAAIAIGSEFLLYRFNDVGRPVALPTSFPFRPFAAAWNGTHYAIVGDFYGQGVLLTPSGEMTAPITLGTSFIPATIASDGDGFFVAGSTVDCQAVMCNAFAIRGVRLKGNLQRIDAHDLVFSEGFGLKGVAGAAWDGSDYVFAFQEAGAGKLARIPVSTAHGVIRTSFEVPMVAENMTVLRDGAIVIAGRDSTSSDAKSHVAFLRGNGSVSKIVEMGNTGNIAETPRLASVADGSVAFIASSMQGAGPHEGVIRVATAIAKPSAVAPPDAPYVGVRLQNGNVVIDWSAAPGTVNGYRLEYRVDNDSWNEYEDWFSPGSGRKTFRQPAFTSQFSVRMRALNDGGASAYSATAMTKPSRRRAVH